MSLRSLYNYIDGGEFTIRNIDLRRKVSYRARKKKHGEPKKGFADQSYREGHTYEDYLSYMKFACVGVVEMYTVKGGAGTLETPSDNDLSGQLHYAFVPDAGWDYGIAEKGV